MRIPDPLPPPFVEVETGDSFIRREGYNEAAGLEYAKRLLMTLA
jgi:hypothetical protein